MSIQLSFPPRAAAWLLRLFAPENHAAAIAGDLSEEFSTIASERGTSHARTWYWRQTVRSIAHLAGAQFRQEPRAIAVGAIGTLLMLQCGQLMLETAARLLLERYEVYAWISASRFWTIYMLGLEHTLLPLIAGWILAAAAKHRAVAAAVVASVLMWSGPLITFWILLHSRYFPDLRHWFTGHIVTHGLLFPLIPTLSLLAGVILCRTVATAHRDLRSTSSL
jgi:hypothetical protein